MKRLFVILILCMSLNCTGKPALELQSVKGRVLRNGRPVSGGAIVMKLADGQANLLVHAEVNAEGWFEPKTLQDSDRLPGLLKGTYNVTYNPPLSTDQSVLPIALPTPAIINPGAKEFAVDIGDMTVSHVP